MFIFERKIKYTIVFVDFFFNIFIYQVWQMNVKNAMLFTILWRINALVVEQRLNGLTFREYALDFQPY